MSYLEELLPEFRKGAKIRRKCWVCGIEGVCKDENYSFHAYDIDADDWEVVPDKPIDWDSIIKNKCLCWFWCEGEEERRIAGLLSYYDYYENQFARYKGKDLAVTYFDHCRPVRRDEVTFYEERKDE